MEWLRNGRKFQTVDLANYWLLDIDMLTAELVKGLSIDQKRHQKADIIDLRLNWALLQWENKKIQVVVGVLCNSFFGVFLTGSKEFGLENWK